MGTTVGESTGVASALGHFSGLGSAAALGFAGNILGHYAGLQQAAAVAASVEKMNLGLLQKCVAAAASARLALH